MSDKDYRERKKRAWWQIAFGIALLLIALYAMDAEAAEARPIIVSCSSEDAAKHIAAAIAENEETAQVLLTLYIMFGVCEILEVPPETPT